MTRVIQFDKAFKYTVAVSAIIIAAGLVGLGVMGFNTGVDFQAGLNSDVAFVPPSMGVAYKGEGTMTLQVSKAEATFISRAPSGESKSYTYEFAQYATLKAIADAFVAVPGVSVELKADGAVDSKLLLGASQTDSLLGEVPTVLHYDAFGASAVKVSTESIRSALKSFGDVAIQRIGGENSSEYMIRLQDPGTDPQFATKVIKGLTTELGKVFGAENVLVKKSDLVGSRFSKTLVTQAFFAVLAAFVGILIYCALRFKPNFALGAVLSVIHDALIMIAFMVFTRMEFNTSSIAAILTIVGYSINDTIVIYDRIREKIKYNPTAPFRENMNRGVTETLSRTFITVATVLLAAISLAVFTTGDIHNMSVAIIVGLISGTYSSIFIASAFVDGWEILAQKRKAKKQLAEAGVAAAAHAALAAANPPRGKK
jgi:preprotein translocase subunit SecF